MSIVREQLPISAVAEVDRAVCAHCGMKSPMPDMGDETARRWVLEAVQRKRQLSPLIDGWSEVHHAVPGATAPVAYLCPACTETLTNPQVTP